MSKGFLTADQREQLSTYPKELSNTNIGRFFTLTPTDLLKVSQQRGDHNRIGFALQLCTLRYLGFIPSNLLDAPQTVVRLLAHQLGVSPQAINVYGEREQTKSNHLLQIMPYEGYRRASTADLLTLEAWLVERALEHDPPTFLLHTATERMHFNRILRPGLMTLEQIVSAARQRAHEVTFERVSPLLSPERKSFLDDLLALDESSSRTTLSWLQRMPNDHTAPQIIATLEKIRFLQNAGVLNWALSPINPNLLKFLANIGARATNQQMQRANQMRRYPVLIAFLKQTLFLMTDVAIDLFDAYLWQRHTDAKVEILHADENNWLRIEKGKWVLPPLEARTDRRARRYSRMPLLSDYPGLILQTCLLR